jgi:hypothetical protein
MIAMNFNTSISYKYLPFLLLLLSFSGAKKWESKYIKQDKNGNLQYIPDEKGNIIPDFSRVGYYHGDKEIPVVPVVKTIEPSGNNSEAIIQEAINDVSKRSRDKNGFRGAIFLKAGTYVIPGVININESGIVLRGEGNKTKLVAAGTVQRALIQVSGKGNIKDAGPRTKITDNYVPVGSTSFTVASSKNFSTGDRIVLYRPATDQWIHDLKMDQIVERNGTKQWKASEYNLGYEREITKVEGNKIFIDNPVVMALEPKYGVGEIFKYSFEGRINNVGIEDMYFESEYTSDTAENHGWEAIRFDKIENGWVRSVSSRYFGYSCVNLESGAKNISVLNCKCTDAKSVITGGRRYSFCNNGQQNLFINCHASDGRHDFVTQSKTCGPNVFYNCTAKNTHADIGPHHRWSTGTLYDNIITDGEINIQDRGNMGSGHGWVGVTQVLWNCKVKSAALQSPYGISGNNYSIGMKGQKVPGHFKDRPDGIWEGLNEEGLEPGSLYLAQLKARRNNKL